MVDYNDIFLQKTGQMGSASPWSDTQIDGFLDNAALKVSGNYATPWGTFDSVPDNSRYAITVSAAIDYWWAKAGEAASKFDMSVGGGGATQRVSSMFDRCMQMIAALSAELESMSWAYLPEGSGDIFVGNLLIRSKDSGYLIPRREDPRGDWTS
jgi:hypothetical protein